MTGGSHEIIIILPATRFVLLKLTTVAHSSQLKSFFVHCSFSIIGPYPLSRLCYAIYCVPGADTMVSNLYFCERPDLVIKILEIQSTIKSCCCISIGFISCQSVTIVEPNYSKPSLCVFLGHRQNSSVSSWYKVGDGFFSNHCPFRGFHSQQKFPSGIVTSNCYSEFLREGQIR